MTFGRYLYSHSKYFILGFMALEAFTWVADIISPFSMKEFVGIQLGILLVTLFIVIGDYIEFRSKKKDGRLT